MGKRGQKKHLKRIAVPSCMGITNKKEYEWITKPNAGPHNGKEAITLSVILRETLKIAKNRKEAKRILNNKWVSVDGRIRREEKFPVGLMDILSLHKEGRHYRMTIDKLGKLSLQEIKTEENNEKIAKVTQKFTHKKGEIRIHLHDGKTIKADTDVRVGDSVVLSLPENKIKNVLKLQKGALCLVKGGKHAGTIATIEELMHKGREGEAQIKDGKSTFITTLKHVCVVDGRIKGAKE